MTAYELADELENKDRLWNVDENLMLKNCEMLRQQADRIAELEKENRAMAEVLKGCDYVAEEANTDGMSLNSMAHPETEGPPSHKVFNSVIDRNSLTMFKPLYTTPQTKELSDEENNLNWWISSFEHLKALGGGISNEMETKLKEMKERLKKASEK